MGIRRHLGSILILPVNGTIVIPALLLWLTGSMAIGCGLGFPLLLIPLVVGASLITLGLVLMVKTISLFARVGRGTLAPWSPTQKLVVVGPYQYVRNPMISGVLLINLGESLILGSAAVLGWFAAFFVANAIYMPLVEEQGLLRRFGDAYAEYRRRVPAWIPRRRPWKPAELPEAEADGVAVGSSKPAVGNGRRETR